MIPKNHYSAPGTQNNLVLYYYCTTTTTVLLLYSTVLLLYYYCTTTVLLLCYYCTTPVLLLCYYCTTPVLLLCYYGATTVLLHTTVPYQASDLVDCEGCLGWRQSLQHERFSVLAVILERSGLGFKLLVIPKHPDRGVRAEPQTLHPSQPRNRPCDTPILL